jgi:hypothetical protein
MYIHALEYLVKLLKFQPGIILCTGFTLRV